MRKCFKKGPCRLKTNQNDDHKCLSGDFYNSCEGLKAPNEHVNFLSNKSASARRITKKEALEYLTPIKICIKCKGI